MNISWKGNNVLKQSVLSQMQIHYEKAVLDDLEIESTVVQVYGWKNHIDYPLTAKMLGLDEGVLHLGFYLWEGFPEDKKSIRDLIQLRMDFLESIPVGVDLSGICHEFIVWRLENADFNITDQHVKDLLRETAETFYLGFAELPLVEQKIQQARLDAQKQISTLWQKEQKTDANVYRALQALETAAAACTAPRNADSAAETAKISLFGSSVSHANLEGETEIICQKLRQLLQAARP